MMDLAGLDPAEGVPDDGQTTKYSDEVDLLGALMDCIQDMTGAAGPPTAADFASEVIIDYVKSITAFDGDILPPERQLPANGKHLMDLSLETLNGIEGVPLQTPIVPARSSDPGLADRTVKGRLVTFQVDNHATTGTPAYWCIKNQHITKLPYHSSSHSCADKAAQTSTSNLYIRAANKSSQTSETIYGISVGTSSCDDISSTATQTTCEQSESASSSSSTDTNWAESNATTAATASRFSEDSSTSGEKTPCTKSRTSQTSGVTKTTQTSCTTRTSQSSWQGGCLSTVTSESTEESAQEQTSLSTLEECENETLQQIGSENLDLLSATAELNPQSVEAPVPVMDPLYDMQNIQSTMLASYCTVMEGAHDTDEEMLQLVTTSEQMPGDTSSFSHPDDTYALEFPLTTVDELSVFHPESADRSQPRIYSTDLLVDIQPRPDMGHLQCAENPFTPRFISPFEPVTEMSGPQEPLIQFSGSTIHPSVDEKSFINFLFSNISNETPDGEVQMKSMHDLSNLEAKFFQVDNPEALFQRHSQSAFQPIFTPFEMPEPIRPIEEISYFYDPDCAQFEMVDNNNNLIEGSKMYDGLTTIDEADVANVTSGDIDRFTSTRSCSEQANSGSEEHTREATDATVTRHQDITQEHVMNVFPVQVFNTVPDFMRSQTPFFYEKGAKAKDMEGNGTDAESGQTLLKQESDGQRTIDGTEPERNYDVLRRRLSAEKARRKTRALFSDHDGNDASTNAGMQSSSSVEDSGSETEEGEMKTVIRKRGLHRMLQSECTRNVGGETKKELPPKSKVTERTSAQFQGSDPETWPLDCHTSHTTANSRCYFPVDRYDFDTEDLAAGLTEDSAILRPLLASENENDFDMDDQSLLGITESVLMGQAELLKSVLPHFGNSDEDTPAGIEALTPCRAVKYVSLPHRRTLFNVPDETPQRVFNETGTPVPPPSPELGRGFHTEVPLSFCDEDIKISREFFGFVDEPSSTRSAETEAGRGGMLAGSPGIRVRSSSDSRSESEFELLVFDEMHPRPIKSLQKPALPKISEEQME
ncbi:uncharacterized protein LOC135401554 isoform X2 [Ornithodoros turicata]|uniref:uncharacterized protein LOC135401554 isoform X2 n=1 Tax=Ornithodoros turicata TaxID=34597 RepID=UPI003139DAD6